MTIIGQHRVTTAPVECEDWKGTYTLDVGTGFTVVDMGYIGDTPESRRLTVVIEQDGLLSGSMGGTISRFDLDTKTRVTEG